LPVPYGARPSSKPAGWLDITGHGWRKSRIWQLKFQIEFHHGQNSGSDFFRELIRKFRLKLLGLRLLCRDCGGQLTKGLGTGRDI
jgi:hypothetical protein